MKIKRTVKEQRMLERHMMSKFSATMKGYGGYTHRIENTTSVGLPDCVCFFDKKTLFVEHKVVKFYQPSQVAFFKRMRAENLVFLNVANEGFYHIGLGGEVEARVRKLPNRDRYVDVDADISTIIMKFITKDYDEFVYYIRKINPITL